MSSTQKKLTQEIKQHHAEYNKHIKAYLSGSDVYGSLYLNASATDLPIGVYIHYTTNPLPGYYKMGGYRSEKDRTNPDAKFALPIPESTMLMCGIATNTKYSGTVVKKTSTSVFVRLTALENSSKYELLYETSHKFHSRQSIPKPTATLNRIVESIIAAQSSITDETIAHIQNEMQSVGATLDYTAFRSRVDRATHQTVSGYSHDLPGYKQMIEAKKHDVTYQVDHIYTVYDGYNSIPKVPISCLTHSANLHYITQSSNSRKNSLSTCTTAELADRIYNSKTNEVYDKQWVHTHRTITIKERLLDWFKDLLFFTNKKGYNNA